jgi:hypothetical protein
LGATETFALKVHKLTADDPRMVDTYNRQSKKELRKHRVTERLTALSTIPQALWSEKHTREFDVIHQLNDDIRRKIVDKIRPLRMGNLPWSPQLQRHFDKIELMKMVVRKRQGVRTSMSKIRRLMARTGEWHAIKVNLQGAEDLLDEAFKEYKDAREHVPELRDNHLDELDKAKAEKNKTMQVKEKKQRKEIEQQRKLSRVVKNLRN